MILRRFMKHVTDQNWFAVGLDVIVVIVGIFLGMQITAQFDYNKERVQEKLYIERLHNDVVDTYKIININADYRQDILDNLNEIMRTLSGENGRSDVTNIECNSIYESHIYADPSVTLPTITELYSSGRISYILDEAIKTKISEYQIALDATEDLKLEIQMGATIMSNQHPEILTMPLSLEGFSSIEKVAVQGVTTISCNYENMTTNKPFRNDMVANAHRLTAHVNRMRIETDLIDELHTLIDENLELTH